MPDPKSLDDPRPHLVDPKTEKNQARLLLVIMGVGLIIRLAIIPFLYREWLDPFVVEHWAFGRIARSLVDGLGFSSPFADTGSTALLPPVFTYVLAFIFRIFGNNSPASVIATGSLNSVFSVLTCIPVYYIARTAFSDRVARWAAWGWALSPYGIYFSADWLWSTSLFTLLLASFFLFSIFLGKTRRTQPWCWFGVLGGVTALTEPVVLAIVPALVAISCYLQFRQHRPWLWKGLLAVMSLVTILSPWIVRNYYVFHHLIPVRDGFGLELWLGNSGYSQHWANRSVHPNHSDAELREYETAGEIAYMAHKQSQALDFIKAHPGWFAWMTARRIVYLWTGFWSFDPKYLADEPLDPPNIFVSTTLSFLALAGLRLAFHNKPIPALYFAAALVFFPLAYYISHPEAYYFRPLDPLINILAMYAVASFIAWRRAARA